MSKPSQYWKEQYQALCGAIQEIHESANEFKLRNDDLPDEPDSVSDEFFISNVLECVDNEEYAKENWGEGKYFRVVRAPLAKQDPKVGECHKCQRLGSLCGEHATEKAVEQIGRMQEANRKICGIGACIHKEHQKVAPNQEGKANG